MKFIDRVKIVVASGKGGPGCVSFRRETKVPRGGPDGGDGGRGGHVVFLANDRVNTLYPYKGKKRIAAKNGRSGEGSKCSGKDGDDLIVEVPIGTVIKDSSGSVIYDFETESQETYIEGGRGGKGNFFFKTSVNQAPEHAQTGEEGSEKEISLELKLLADIGLIGFPNAGKSTLISSITAAKPKVADYPFTTLNPQLGILELGDGRSIKIADIPGLIEGAHKGVGLGHEFLKHIERTKAFVHLLDVSDFADRDLWQDYESINHELLEYEKAQNLPIKLSGRPQIVALTKIDSVTGDRLDYWETVFARKGIDCISISASTRNGLEDLKKRMVDFVYGEKNES